MDSATRSRLFTENYLKEHIWATKQMAKGALSNAPSKSRYKLKIAPGLYYDAKEMPNAWHRFWQHALLGWTWWEVRD